MSASLMVVGDAPTASEARKGRAFSGEGGALLKSLLQTLGQDPSEVHYTYAVPDAQPGNKVPGITAIRNALPHLTAELGEHRPTKVLTCGGVALTGVLGATRVLPVTKNRGQAQWVTMGDQTFLHVGTINPSLVLRDPDMFPDLLFDLEKVLRIDAPLPAPIVETHVVADYSELGERLEVMAQASVIACDLETYGFRPTQDALLSIGFGVTDWDGNGEAVIVPEDLLHRPKVRDLIGDFLTQADARFIFHNAKFDLQFLHHYFGRPLPAGMSLGDTMLLHYLWDERPIGRYLGHGLKDIARTWYDVPDYHWDFEAFYATPKEERDYEALYRYQAQDCVYTARLWFDLIERLEAEVRDDPGTFDPMRVHDQVLAPGARAFAQAEYHGTYIDQAFFTSMGSMLEQRSADHLSALEAVAGEGFNPGSPAQVKKYINDTMGGLVRLDVRKGYMRAASDESSTDRETLEAMIRLWGKDDDRSKVLQHIIDYRNAQKVLQTNVTGLLSRTDEQSRIRPSFQLAGTATGRLSCREPNFQNIPAYSEYNVREGFAAPPGHVFVEADYSQLELRVAAWLSEDPDLIEVFASGKDIHAEVAVAMFHKPAEDITSQERYMAKRVDFGILYGRSSKALAEGPEMDYYVDNLGGERWTLEQAELYVTRFLDGFPRLRDWMKKTADDAVRNGFVDTPLGRRRRFPYITRSIVGHTRRQAVNTPIQSVASDLTMQALLRINEHRSQFNGHILFAVHDSIALEIPRDDLARAVPILRHTMEQEVEVDRKGIPFTCDIEVGDNWGTAKKYSEEPPVARLSRSRRTKR